MNFLQKQFLSALKEAPEQTVLMSRRNCHMEGLDSVVVSVNENGSLVRAFFAHENHKMYPDAKGQWSIGVHNHKYDLTLSQLSGTSWNRRYSLTGIKSLMTDSTLNNVYEYSSGLGKEMAAVLKDTKYLMHERATEIRQIHIHYTQLHTVEVRKGKKASWLVEEGIVRQETTTLVSHLLPEELLKDTLYQGFESKQEVIDMVGSFWREEK